MQKRLKSESENLRSEKDAQILQLKTTMQETKGKDDAEITELKNQVDTD